MFWKKKKEENQVEVFLNKNLEKENKLIPTIKIVLTSLEKDIVDYEWKHPQCCNCGLMVQGILNVTPRNVNKIFHYLLSFNDAKTTWKSQAQQYCSVTGMPLNLVFEVLHNKGFKIEDIVHLEFLNNSAILELSGIDTTKKSYYSNRNNLIKYLKAWLNILEGHPEDGKLSDKNKLEAELLVAVNAEDYSRATLIRDKILQFA